MKMRFAPKLILPLLQCLVFITEAATEASSPYCYRNITETSYKTVTKTRIKNVRSKNFFKKMVSKKDTQIEVYEDQEPVYTTKVERICCEGYKMTEYELCEPQCLENGCPAHSKCVEPEVCECLKGYFSARSVHDNKHYCQPICEVACPEHSECVGPNQCACRKGYHNNNLKCEPHCLSGCPFGGSCIAPNKCSCAEGYKALEGTCLASCSLGDHCQNGVCVAQDQCECNYGFKWNNETFICELDDIESSTFNNYFSKSEQLTKAWLEVSSNDDIDPSEVFDESIDTTESWVTDDYGYTTHYPICPNDYIFVKGKCLPLKFASSDIDCWQKPCPDENALCLENGTCACKDGFILFKSLSEDSNTFEQNISIVCLTPAEYEAKMQEITQQSEESTSWASIFFMGLGLVIISVALVILVMKVLYRRTGKKDVEGKNLACVYDNRDHFDAEKSVI